MRMTQEEFRNERIYTATMVQVKKMLSLGLITAADYWRMNTKMKEKYRPISDGLVSEIDLICAKNRA